MDKNWTVEKAAEHLNVTPQVIQSWIETEVLREKNGGLPAEQFGDNMSEQLKKEMAILQQKVLASDEE